MFNCYCLKINGRPYAYLKYEAQCESLQNYIEIKMTLPATFEIVGAYVPDIDF